MKNYKENELDGIKTIGQLVCLVETGNPHYYLDNAITTEDLDTIRDFWKSGLYTSGLILERALWKHNIQVIRFLIENGADVNNEDGKEYSLSFLGRAILNGDIEIVKLLVEAGASIKTQYPTLTDYNNSEVVKFLLNAGVSLRSDALHRAIDYSNAEVVKLLIEAGADVNKAWNGEPPIISALREDNPEMIKLLIEAGADVNEKGNYSKTPIELAIRKKGLYIRDSWKNNLECARLLLEAGADTKNFSLIRVINGKLLIKNA